MNEFKKIEGIAIEVNTPDGFDVSEHVTIKKIDEALTPKP